MEKLHLVVGLGNPGREYSKTRHNAGFMVVQRLAERSKADWTREKRFKASTARVEEGLRKLILAQPEAFMNASGEAVGALMNFYRVPPAQTLVVVDDADLPLGQLRLRGSGSSGGHHGLESIEAHLGTREYPRLRIGIGRESSQQREITDYVLAKFSKAEAELLEKVLIRGCEQIECWFNEGIG